MTVAKAEYFNALQDILKLDLSTCTTEICIAARSDKESMPEFRRLLVGQDVQKEFRAIVERALFAYQKELLQHNLEVLEFDVGSQAACYQVEHLDLSKPPYDHIVKQTQELSMLQSLDTFREEPSFIEKMRFYVIVLHPPQGEAIYFYRRYSPARILKAPIALQRVVGLDNGDEFKKVVTPIFQFDEHIDCISRATNLFVLAKNHFYYMFQILDELIESAKDTLDLIQKSIPIENFKLFKIACINDKAKMAKLMSIARRPYLSTLTIADMRPVIKKHNLHIPIVDRNNGQQQMLSFDKDYPRDILKLLDDDYLTSIMTGQNYEVDAKRYL